MGPYWTAKLKKKNFGDYWVSCIAHKLGLRDLNNFDIVVGGGTTLTDYWISRYQDECVMSGKTVIGKTLLLGVGASSENSISKDLILNAYGSFLNILWVRGKATTNLLQSYGLSVPSIGDSAELQVIFQSPLFRSKEGLNTPIFAPNATTYDAAKSIKGAVTLSPWIENESELENLLTRVKDAEFVVAGSLHIAVASYLLGTPFAIDLSHIDKNGYWKYQDWFQSVGIEPVFFHGSIDLARKDFDMARIPAWDPSRVEKMIERIKEFGLDTHKTSSPSQIRESVDFLKARALSRGYIQR